MSMETTKPSIEDMNRVIADFMDYLKLNKKKEDPYLYAMKHAYDYGNLKYHSSWDWLIPVWEKLWYNCIVPMNLEKEWANIRGNRLARAILYGTIQEAHKEAFDAITWYNKHTSQP